MAQAMSRYAVRVRGRDNGEQVVLVFASHPEAARAAAVDKVEDRLLRHLGIKRHPSFYTATEVTEA